jgi:hypothetical protein
MNFDVVSLVYTDEEAPLEYASVRVFRRKIRTDA